MSNLRQTILVVDDAPENIDIIGEVLGKDYKIQVAINGKTALKIAESAPSPDLILLDIIMPGMDGYEVCRRLKSNPVTEHIPILFLTSKTTAADEAKGLETGAVDYLSKPINPPVVKERVRTHLALYDQKRMLEDMVRSRTAQLYETQLEIMRCLGRAAEFKDNETGMHVTRMSHYAKMIAQAAGFEEYLANQLFYASPMHDIGKIGIPDHILLKPGKLSDEEWLIMKQHPEIGAALLGTQTGSSIIELSRVIALTHHEKWDGKGYPKGLSREQIPILGRIVAIADVFDALTSKRPYKRAWAVKEAIDHIKKESGKHFDPELVAVFMKITPEILKVKDKYKDNESL